MPCGGIKAALRRSDLTKPLSLHDVHRPSGARSVGVTEYGLLSVVLCWQSVGSIRTKHRRESVGSDGRVPYG